MTHPNLAQRQADAIKARRADIITVREGQVTATIDLRRLTALADCTTITVSGGRATLARNWPRLSSGEELLWSVAAWLNGHADLPPIDTLRDGLDRSNWIVVRHIISGTDAVDSLMAAVCDAERRAREAHDDGRCGESGWSCSYCEQRDAS
ncbi:hypothetical protein [Nocardioides sp. REDSEA-S30_B4]|jgi:hypothetical protein|uniref:hypothetical protein n=1 Tax=Nocardioides sp. REDSEA-S30_B4 TaxID=1811552 RepID=UPI000AACDA65|nr:hypothetical protein [Nocardioides sp. REDSEA-S30_B4]